MALFEKNKLTALIQEIDAQESIVGAQRAEIQQTIGGNQEMVTHTLYFNIGESRKVGSPLAQAAAKLETAREQAAAYIAPLIEEAGKLGAEITAMHERNLALVTEPIRAVLKPIFGGATERYLNVAPAVVAEREYQSRHIVQDWGWSLGQLAKCPIGEGRNPAREAYKMIEAVRSSHLVVSGHSKDLIEKQKP